MASAPKHVSSRNATTQFAQQHRIFSFSILTCGSHARFIRWVRAGAIVTKHFDYHHHPAALAEFLWRFGQLSRLQRGHDATVVLANRAESRQLEEAIFAHIADTVKRQILRIQDTLDPTFAYHKIACTSSDGSLRKFILQKPASSSTALSPVGRSTRGYFALDVQMGELVFLKDYWRPLDSTRPLESDACTALLDAHVPHLPGVRLAGDVQDSDGCDQATLTERSRNVEAFCSLKGVRGYRHHRVVQDIAYPLDTARGS